MKADRGRLAFTALILLFVLFFIVTSFSYEHDARLIPLLVGFSTLVLVLAVLVNEIHPVSIIEKMNVDWTKDLKVQESSPKKKEKVAAKKLLIIICWIFGFFLFIFLFGFPISIALFTFAFLKIEGKVSWAKALLTAVIVSAAVFVIFEWAMGFGLFEGVLFGEIIPPI
ncbi:MAG: tripartite tricarboxylate transporter TctB family protein [Candidatus Aminicenantes bacterium]|nr:tripartite tricarboxylate transporter TctB family protein [Candidatus Aminicenantes bacterium]